MIYFLGEEKIVGFDIHEVNGFSARLSKVKLTGKRIRFSNPSEFKFNKKYSNQSGLLTPNQS